MNPRSGPVRITPAECRPSYLRAEAASFDRETRRKRRRRVLECVVTWTVLIGASLAVWAGLIAWVTS